MEVSKVSGDAQGARAPRVDWRTGKPMLEHDEAFWRDHEQRRLQQGLSVPQYCAAHGLALSTYRHRVSGKKRTSAKAPTSTMSLPAMTFVPVAAAGEPAVVEVVLQDMTLRLSGEAAERVLSGVLARLT